MSEQNLCETHAEVQTPGGYCPVCMYNQWQDAEQRAEQAEAERDKHLELIGSLQDTVSQLAQERDTARQEAAKLRDGINEALHHLGRSLPYTARASLDAALEESALHPSDAPASDSGGLKPCPFCGSHPKIEHLDWRDNSDHSIRCSNEHCPGDPGALAHSRSEAVAAWNTRTTDPAPADHPETDAASEAHTGYEKSINHHLSQPAPAVPDGKAQEHADKIGFTRETAMSILGNGLEEASEFDFEAVCTIAALAIRSVNDRHRATHTADGDSPAVPDWLPIETAPKDGTEILIRGYFKERKYTTDVYHDWWNRHDLQWTRWPHVDSPTHWMPIPSIPAAPTPDEDGE